MNFLMVLMSGEVCEFKKTLKSLLSLFYSIIKGDKMNFDVVCFGSAVVDIFVDTDVAERMGQEGKRVMSYPVGSKILLNNLRFDIGGGGTNSAVAFSRLGFKTGYIGKIGNDNHGNEILEMLKEEKIKFLGKVAKKQLSGYSIILDSKQHNRTILTYKAVNNELDIKDVPLRKIKTKWLYLSSMIEKSFETQKKITETLQSKGAKIAFNPSEYLIKKENIIPILGLCDILVLNKEEAGLLTDESDLLKGLYKLGPNIVVITDGNNPVTAYDGEKKYTFKPQKNDVVETTGAGDAFASGFVAGQILGKSISQSLNLGYKESQSVLRYFGAKNNLLKKDLKRFWKSKV